MKLKIHSKLYRTAELERDEAKPNRIRLSVSSDEPYPRWDIDNGEYWEVLDHRAGGIVDDRLNAGIGFLFNHDRAILLGRSYGYDTDGHKCFVEPTLSEADDVKSYVTKIREGILVDASIGYECLGEGEEIGEKDGRPIIRFQFRIFETSVVTIPADFKVGVERRMRELEEKSEPKEIVIVEKKSVDTRTDENKTTLNDSQESENSMKKRNFRFEADKGDNATTGTATAADVSRAKSEGQSAGALAERERVTGIQKLSKHFAEKGIAGRKIDTADAAIEHITSGKSLADFQSFVMAGEFKEVVPVATPEGGEQRLDENGGESRIQIVNERQASRIIKSIGQNFVESDNFKKQSGQRRRNFSVEIPNVSSFRATAATSTITNFNGIVQLPNIVEIGVQQATVADLLSQGTTNLAAVPYLQEDALTVAATTVAEGAAKPEVTWDWSQTSAPVKKIAVISKVTDELFADVPTIQSYVNMRLRYMVEIVEDAQLLTGDGTGANITGILATGGIQTQAKGADTVLDAVRKAMTKVQSTGFFPPTGAVFHPNDWEAISLAKDANGQYLAGGPFYAPYGNGEFVMFYRIWGLSVVVTTSMTENTGLVGNFKLGASIFRRQGITIDSTNSNEDDFKNNLIALRAEERLALAVWRPKAFCQVTGI